MRTVLTTKFIASLKPAAPGTRVPTTGMRWSRASACAVTARGTKSASSSTGVGPGSRAPARRSLGDAGQAAAEPPHVRVRANGSTWWSGVWTPKSKGRVKQRSGGTAPPPDDICGGRGSVVRGRSQIAAAGPSR